MFQGRPSGSTGPNWAQPIEQTADDGLSAMTTLRVLLEDEGAATAVEYGLIVAAIAGLILVVVFTLGRKVKNAFNNVSSALP
jgi:pilus assembly protein Flp/PilA